MRPKRRGRASSLTPCGVLAALCIRVPMVILMVVPLESEHSGFRRRESEQKGRSLPNAPRLSQRPPGALRRPLLTVPEPLNHRSLVKHRRLCGGGPCWQRKLTGNGSGELRTGVCTLISAVAELGEGPLDFPRPLHRAPPWFLRLLRPAPIARGAAMSRGTEGTRRGCPWW